MKKINIKQIENIAKVFTVLTWLAVSWVVFGFNDVYSDFNLDDFIFGVVVFGFGISLPLYVLTRLYNHIIDKLSNK